MSDERIGESELLAYVDGELDTGARIAVEAHLREHPEIAAQVLDDLRLCHELRLFLGQEDWPAPPRSVGLARELTRGLHRRSFGVRLRRGLAAAALVAAGWFGHAEFSLFVDQVVASPSVPGFAEEATGVHNVLRLKLETGHGPERALLALPAGDEVPMPALGQGLRFVGSDLAPWDGGIALVALYEAPEGDLVSLFAAKSTSFAVEAPRAAELHGVTSVFWREGPFAYALSGKIPQAELLAIAQGAAAVPWSSPSPQPANPGGTHG